MASKYDKFIEQIKTDYVINKLTKREIEEKYGIKTHNFVPKVLGDLLRSRSEVSRLSRAKHPESYVMKEATKEKIRNARISFLKKHPEQSAWRKNNEPSYPEKCFISFLKSYEYDAKYYIEREYPFFPYYIDFAFVDEKIAVEIDGGQHLNEDRAERDRKKDKLLTENDWKVIRITENTAKTDWKTINEILKGTLDKTLNNKIQRVGIFKHKSAAHKKKDRDAFGRTEKETKNYVLHRIVKNRPEKDELCNLLKTEKSFCRVGRKYNVTDNAVRKWCKWYKIPTNIKYYKMLGSSK